MLWPKLRDTVPAIFVDLGRDIGLILRWGNVEKPRFGLFWMKVAFALAEPKLDRGAMMGDHWLVRLGVLNILGVIIMLQLDILGTKVFIVLRRLGHTVAEVVYLILEIPLRLRFLSGGISTGGVALGIEAGLALHSRVWKVEEAMEHDRGGSQRGL
ncbi:unnamed protein product [Prunus armeniaca]